MPASAEEPVPLEAYGELPGISDAAASLTGRNVALIGTFNNARHIIVVDGNMKPVLIQPTGDIKFRGFEFVGDHSLLFFRSETVDVTGFTADKYELMQALVLPLGQDLEISAIFAKDRHLGNAVFGSHGLRLIDGRWTGFFGALENERTGTGEYYFGHGRPALYAVDLLTMKSRRIAKSPPEQTRRDWLVDANGAVAATFDISRESGNWTIKNSAYKIIASGSHPKGGAGLVGFGPTSATLIYSAEDQEGKGHWFEVPIAGGEAKPFLEDLDIVRTYWNHQTGELLGYLEDGPGKAPVLYDPELQKRAAKTLKTFAGFNPRLIDWTPNFDKVIVHTDGKGDSGTWFLVDLETKRADALGYDRPTINPGRVGPISTVNYAAQDGLEMDGILTLPPGREAKNLPVVMLPHGGPHAHDTESFDWWAQAFASRGYAVFQPNFRGSTGRGAAFEQAGYGQWGLKMQTDISDGLAMLAEKGIVDPKRACIVGASYGGYAALAGVTLQDGLYRCAVSVAGVSDINLMYLTDNRESGGNKLLKRSLLEELGPRDGWAAVSPRKQAERANAPILLIHGKDDTVVPFQQSAKMADALKDAGKPFEFVTLQSEDHWLSRAETRKQMLKEAVAFVQKHNPAD
ncbi:MAG: prolyl oligopeptidase family serine peptidase [Sphingomonadaceae bacterium]